MVSGSIWRSLLAVSEDLAEVRTAWQGAKASPFQGRKAASFLAGHSDAGGLSVSGLLQLLCAAGVGHLSIRRSDSRVHVEGIQKVSQFSNFGLGSPHLPH